MFRAAALLFAVQLTAGCGRGDPGGEARPDVPEAERYGGTAGVLLAQPLQPLNPLTADIRPNLQLHQFALSRRCCVVTMPS